LLETEASHGGLRTSGIIYEIFNKLLCELIGLQTFLNFPLIGGLGVVSLTEPAIFTMFLEKDLCMEKLVVLLVLVEKVLELISGQAWALLSAKIFER
jgi:hypothetical protein